MNLSLQHDDRRLLDLLLAEEGIDRSAAAGIRRDDSTTPPLSRAQRRLWFLQQSAPDSPAYNVLSAVQLTGALNIAAVEQSLNEIVRRHAVLRSCFPGAADGPKVQLLPDLPLQPTIFDLGGLDDEQRQQEVRRHSAAEASKPFDLARGPLIRVRLLRLAERDHVAILTMHHIVTDGWSMSLFIEEFCRLYTDFSRGRPSPLGELDIQYSDFSRWQEQWLSSSEASGQLAWWTRALDGFTPLELPTDRPRPAQPSFEGAAHTFTISPLVRDAFKSLARQEGATLFISLLTAFNVLLYRYCGRDDIVAGTPVANRNRPELEPLIGFFVNTLVMRSDLSGHPGFRELMHRVRDFAVQAYAHQDLPFDVLVSELVADRATAHNPVFQVMFALESAPAARLDLPGLGIAPLDLESKTAKFDLLLNMSDTPAGLVGGLQYSTDLFEAETIERMAGHFRMLLRSIAGDPEQSVAALPMLGGAERHQILIEWNQTDSAFPKDKCIHELFEEQVRRHPERVALEFRHQRLTYGELNGRANQLARHLRSLGAGPKTLSALVVERSVEMALALLGILKAGSAYVPLQPDDPQERLATLLVEIAPSVVLTQERFADGLASTEAQVLRLDSEWSAIAHASRRDRQPAGSSEGLAYVLFTSGSTGAPKGVSVAHRSVVRLVKKTDYARLGEDEVFLQLAPLQFDASTLEVWAPLLNGGKLVVAEPQTPSLEEIGGYIRRCQITTLWLTAGLFHLMVDERLSDLKPLAQLLVGGDVLSVGHVSRALGELPGCRLINGYGPTENTTFTCCHRIEDADLQSPSIPIGRPIANSRVYILDRHLQPTPIGVPGQLCISGEGLARGYLNRPGLTDQRFIDNPIASDPDSRMYKTGDLCRWRPAGVIEFLGRRDRQVKIRGHRIEMGEIESALSRHPQVRQAVVLACQGRAGHRELVAYVAGRSSLSAAGLRDALMARLPAYMVPARYVLLDVLPLNENGKVDRKALPPPETALPEPVAEFVAPRNELEECLANTWQDVLRCERVGIYDSYFELGGDSITAIQLVSRLTRAGWRLRVADLLRHPTIAQLATCLKPDRERREVGDEVGEIPLTAVQRWFFEHCSTGRHHFNQAVLLRAGEPLDEDRLQQALSQLQERHDALRLTFQERGGRLRQSCNPPTDRVVPQVIDLRNQADAAAALEGHAEEVQRGIDLAQGPLLKAALFRCPDADRLLLVIHHLAVDGVSWRILLEDLQIAYCNMDPAPRTSSFRSWAEHVQRMAGTEELRAELDYWLAVEKSGVARLPINSKGTTNSYGDTQTVSERLSEEETAWLLKGAHRAYQTQIMDLLLAALGRALQGWTGNDDMLITLEGHGREGADDSLDLTRTVGWFTSLYPFVVPTQGNDLGRRILQVKDRLRRVPNKGAGYGILRYLAGCPLTANPQISFNYLGQFGPPGDGDGLLEFADEATGRAISGDMQRVHELDFVALVGKGRLVLSLHFNPQRLPMKEASELLADVRRQMRLVIEHCRRKVQEVEAAQPLAKGSDADSDLTAPDADLAALSPATVRGLIDGRIESVYPLSPLQQGLLFQSLFDPSSEAYFVQVTYQFFGLLQPDAFRQSWHELSGRHAALRSAFLHQDLTQPLQVVLSDRVPEVSFTDLRRLAAAEQEVQIEEYRQAERRRGFDLHRDVLMRVAVFRRREKDYQFVWSYHHILLDGWCLAILQRDFLHFYNARLSGRRAQLPPAVPYRDYIRWLGSRDEGSARRFWRSYLDGYEQPARLPRMGRTGESQPSSLEEEVLELDAVVSKKLARLAVKAGVTLNIVIQSCWGLLLSHCNDRPDVVFGAVVSGRPSELAGVEEIVGLFINTVPVRIACEPGKSFLELLRDTQEAAFASQPHHHLCLPEIQSQSALGRDLFDHVIIFENYPLGAAADSEEGGAEVGIVPVQAHDCTHYDLDLTVVPGQRMTFKFTYNAHAYHREEVRRTVRQFGAALACLLRDPEQRLGETDILPAGQKETLLHRFNATAREYPREKTIVDLFQEQADKSPEATAVQCDGREMTYRELNRQANQLAHCLLKLGTRAGDRVGLCVQRTLDMIVAPLAIFKAGAAFVPLDPEYPSERIAFMLADAGVRVLLMQRSVRDRLCQYEGRMVCLDADRHEISRLPAGNPPRISPRQLAYVVFTSGSTGRPKGVAVAHRGVTNMAFAWRRAYGLAEFPVRLLQMVSMSFDVFIGDLVRAFTNGGALVVCPSDVRVDPAALYELLAEQRISIFEATPGVVVPLMEYIHENDLSVECLKILIVGSDLLPLHQFRNLLDRFGASVRVLNSYGVTEATIDSCFFEVSDSSDLPATVAAPIGKPMQNTRFYVLDRLRRLLPQGAVGELYIGGEGVADGYLNRKERTTERFVEIPLLPGQRLYRTGDLVRWLADGNLEFLGRADQQVKVRGYRIEPGEIEARLVRCEAVESAVVSACRIGETKELVAYVVADEGWDVDRVRRQLSQSLPKYMLPNLFVRLEHLPLTPNGKLDRQALPDPRSAAVRSADLVTARNATEARLVSIWRQVLQIDAIGVHDDFFELGGHSLKAMQVVSQIHKQLKAKIAVSSIFDARTIENLAGVVAATDQTAFSRIEPAPEQESYALSHAQHRLWILHHLDAASAYNMPEATSFDVAIDMAALQQAFTRLIRRHEALRTAFILVDGEPRQKILPEIEFSIREIDLRSCGRPQQRARQIVDQEAKAPFELTTPPLFRALVVRLPQDRSIFVLNMHHIIGDGWSGVVLFRELLAQYDACLGGQPGPLKPLRIQYKDFAVWQNAKGFKREEEYWLAKLAGAPECLRLPYDRPPEGKRDFRGSTESIAFSSELTRGIRSLARQHNTTVSNALLTLFKLSLFQWTGQDDFVVGMSVANRNHPDLEDLIGFFVNILPIRTRFSADMEFEELLRQIIHNTYEAFEHQDYPFDLLIQRLNPARYSNRQPIFNVLYAFQNFTDVHVDSELIAPRQDEGGRAQGEQPDEDWSSFEFSFTASKFDLTLFALDEEGAIHLFCEYDTGLFLEGTIKRQLERLRRYTEMATSQLARPTVSLHQKARRHAS